MIGIKIKGSFLDIPENTSIGFDLNSPLYFSDDVDIIQGSYSFPISIPLTSRNRGILEYPDIIENDSRFISNEICEIWSNGFPCFKGIGYIKNSTIDQVEFYILVDSLSMLKDIHLNELPLETTYLGSTQPDVLVNMKLTTNNTDDFTHIFFPLWNPYFYDDKTALGFDHATFQNPWSNAASDFLTGAISDDYITTPFLKLNYLLNVMFESSGFSLENLFQTTLELRNLVLYNNFSISLNGFINPYVNFKNHVSNTTCAEFLRKLKGAFNLGIFIDYYNQTTEIIPAKDLLIRPIKHNWTTVTEFSYVKSEADMLPEQFCYATPHNSIIPDLNTLRVFQVSSFPADTDDEGLYYDTSIEKYFYHKPIVSGAPAVNIIVSVDDCYDIYSDHPNDTSDNWDLLKMSRRSDLLRTYSNGMKTLPNMRVFFGGTSGVPGHIPAINQKGCADDPKVPFDDILIFYRGFRGDFTLPWSYPAASSELTDLDGEIFEVGYAATGGTPPTGAYPPVDAVYSLHWKDETVDLPDTGLFRAWWGSWFEMLESAKFVERRVYLSEADILNFSFKDKVRIGNMNYFVRKIRVNLTSNGLQPCEVSLVSTV